LPTGSGRSYKLTAIPPSGSIYTQFTLSNIRVESDKVEFIELQYNHATPVTAIDLQTQHQNGTYSNPTTVTLSATAAAGYTIANTYYKVDGGAQQAYSSAFTVSGTGDHIVEFWSFDNSGVQEEHKAKNFTLQNLPITTTLNASADTYIRSGSPHENEGAGLFMKVQQNGSNRGLVRYSQSALQSAVGGGTVLSAKIRLTITDNGNNWGTTGRTVDIHRLTSDWTEGNGTEADRGNGPGATWSCALDSLIENLVKNCSGAAEWEMGLPNNHSVHPWVQTASATQTITNNQSGVVEYDVTADIQAFVNGTNNNYGWIIRKTDEGQSGQVSFGTKESSTAPQLVVTYQP